MTAGVAMVDLGREHESIRPELERAIARTLDSSRFILGPTVREFEVAVSQFLGVRHAIGLSSGTDALLVALTALGVGPGDEVVTTPFSFFATIEGILRVGASPRFVDVDAATLNLDPGRLRNSITTRTRAIVPVHLYGSVAPIDEIVAVGAELGVPVVEDAAQAFGSRMGGRFAGSFGAIGCFSFFPTKVLGGIGDGGLAVTDDDALAAKCRQLRDHGASSRGVHTEVGGNFRLDAIQAAVLRVKLDHVRDRIAARVAHGAAYDEVFARSSGVTPVERSYGWNGAVYTLRVAEGRRDALRAYLAERGIETAIYYERPLHLQPALVRLAIRPGALLESERAANEVLSLPIHPEMRVAERETVVEAIDEFFR